LGRERLAADVGHHLREIANAALVVDDAGLFTAARAKADELHGAISPGFWKVNRGGASIMHAGGRQARRRRSPDEGFLRMTVPIISRVRPATVADWQLAPNIAPIEPDYGICRLHSAPRPHRITACTRAVRQAASDAGIRGATRWRGSNPRGFAGQANSRGVGRGRPQAGLVHFGAAGDASKCAGKCAAVDQDVLPGEIAGLRRAEKGAGSSELIGGAEALGRYGGDPVGPGLLDRDAAVLGIGLEIRA